MAGLNKILKKFFAHEIILLLRDVNDHFKKLKGIYFNESRFAASGLDNKLSKYLNFKKGFYIELGAHDGVFSSNTYYLQKKLKWSGILIEPSLDLFFKCVKNRGNLNTVLNYACVPFDYNEKFLELVYSGAMTIAKDGGDIKDVDHHAKEGMNFIPNYNQLIEFCAKAKTLNEILIENNVDKRIDFLSLDVEGFEIGVLKGIDFQKFKFKYMLIESRDINKMNEFLTEKGYILKEQLTEIDYLFYNKNY